MPQPTMLTLSTLIAAFKGITRNPADNLLKKALD
jgi:hypothetical protein